MNILAIIPARGGSKGLKKKNIKNFCGKPLIQYSIEAGQRSKYINQIIVSSDDLEILDFSKSLGAKTIKRPSELSSDDSVVIDAIFHVIIKEKELGNEYDYIVLLEPTSPLRTTNDIDKTIEKVIKMEADSGATFSETNVVPDRIWRIKEDIPSSFIEGSNPFLPRQLLEKGYYLNGMVYVTKVSKLFEEKSIFAGKVIASIIPNERAVDIDNIYDFQFAEIIYEKIFERNEE